MDEETKIIEYYSKFGINITSETAKRIASIDRDYSTLGFPGFAVSLAGFIKNNSIALDTKKGIPCTRKL